MEGWERAKPLEKGLLGKKVRRTRGEVVHAQEGGFEGGERG